MKRLYTIVIVLLSALVLALLGSSCNTAPELIEELNLPNVLTPTSTSATVSNADGQTVTFTWSSSSTATQYVLYIYQWETDEAPEDIYSTDDGVLDEDEDGNVILYLADEDGNRDSIIDATPYETYEGENAIPQGSGKTTTWSEFLEADVTYFACLKAQNLDADGNPLQGDSHWVAFRYPIEPYLVMDALPSFSLTARTENSISLEWEANSEDTQIVNQIRVSPNPDNAKSSYKAYAVTNGETTATVDGLDASTQYTLTANYGSAVRGTIVAWTRPNTDGFTTCSDTNAIINALTSAGETGDAVKILLPYNDGEPYDLDEIPVLSEVEIVGQEDEAGNKPVVIGDVVLYPEGVTYTRKGEETASSGTTGTAGLFSVATIAKGASYLRLEGIAFSGETTEKHNEALISYGITAGDDFTSSANTVDIEVVNCDFDSYKCGPIYDNSKKLHYSSILFDGVYVTNITGDGGDYFDFRTSDIDAITIKNSTFDGGGRTFFRYSGSMTIGDFTFSNNTVNNVCSFNNSNNKGVFRIQPSAFTGKYTLTGNLFLNINAMPDYDVLIWSDCVAPCDGGASSESSGSVEAIGGYEVAKNFFYNNAANFFYDNVEAKTGNGHKAFSEDLATAGGGATLSEDPCISSERENFYVTDNDVINAGAGDPRWYADYIPEPEEELEVVEYGYSWDLTDTKTFYDEVDETVVRGNLQFIVESTPIEVSDAGFHFTSKSTLMTYSGVPTDGAIAFLVNGPGSVVLSTTGGYNTQIEVSYATYDTEKGEVTSSTTTVGGAVSSGVTAEYVPLVNIAEDGSETCIVYIYASNAIYLSELSWTDELGSSVDLTLGTPVAKISPETIAEGDTDEVKISWDEVSNAGSYTVYSYDSSADDEENAYTEVKSGITDNYYVIEDSDQLAAGSAYSYVVQALPSEESSRTASGYSDPVTLTVTYAWNDLPTDAATTWDTTTWEALYDEHGSSTWKPEGTPEVYSDGYLAFYNGTDGSGYTFTTGDLSATDTGVYNVKLGGGGNATKCNLQFKVTTAGTLKVTALTGGAEERYMNVYVAGTKFTDSDHTDGNYSLGTTNAEGNYPVENSIALSDINEETVISVCSKGSGINVYVITWTPSGVN